MSEGRANEATSNLIQQKEKKIGGVSGMVVSVDVSTVENNSVDDDLGDEISGDENLRGATVTPGYKKMTEHTTVPSTMNNEHQVNLGKEMKKLRAEVKGIVKVTMFRTVKFILNNAQLAWNNPRLAGQILDRLGIKGEENRARTWNDCKTTANLALRERRSAVNAAIKQGVVGKLIDCCVNLR